MWEGSCNVICHAMAMLDYPHKSRYFEATKSCHDHLTVFFEGCHLYQMLFFPRIARCRSSQITVSHPHLSVPTEHLLLENFSQRSCICSWVHQLSLADLKCIRSAVWFNSMEFRFSMVARLDIADVNLFHLNHHRSLLIVEPEVFNLARRLFPSLASHF